MPCGERCYQRLGRANSFLEGSREIIAHPRQIQKIFPDDRSGVKAVGRPKLHGERVKTRFERIKWNDEVESSLRGLGTVR